MSLICCKCYSLEDQPSFVLAPRKGISINSTLAVGTRCPPAQIPPLPFFPTLPTGEVACRFPLIYRGRSKLPYALPQGVQVHPSPPGRPPGANRRGWLLLLRPRGAFAPVPAHPSQGAFWLFLRAGLKIVRSQRAERFGRDLPPGHAEAWSNTMSWRQKLVLCQATSGGGHAELLSQCPARHLYSSPVL